MPAPDPFVAAPQFVERAGQRVFYRPAGNVTFEQGVDMVANAIRWARAQQAQDILVNIQGLHGVAHISTFMRYEFARRIAEVAGPVRIAMVVAAEMIDPEKIGALVAQNRGVTGDVFSSEAAALAWLDARI
jgi:hypothetical protein